MDQQVHCRSVVLLSCLLRGSLSLLLLLLPLSLRAQQPDEDWSGDRELFRIGADGLMTLTPDAAATDRATIRRSYPIESGRGAVWELECHYDKRPSRYNTFAWTIFLEQTNDGLYHYLLRPEEHGTELLLERSFFPREEATDRPARTETLSRISFADADRSWQHLRFRVDYDPQETGHLRLSCLTQDEGFRRAEEAAPLLGGRLIGEVSFAVRYTSGRMKEVAWTEPLPSPAEAEPLQILTKTFLPDGRLSLSLDRAVSITEATAELDGRSFPLSHGLLLSRLLIGPLPSGAGSVRVTLRGLRSFVGEEPDLSLDLERSSRPDGGDSGQQQRLLFTELMTDPPTVGSLRQLPYIELHNPTSAAIALGDFTLRYRKSDYPLPDYSIAPGAYLILYPAEAVLPPDLADAGIPLADFPAFSGSFPLALIGSDGSASDALEVGDEFFEPGIPRKGRAMERVSISPAQWRSSTEAKGGTPGEATRMTPYAPVARGELVINELMLSPETLGEKYIELYNNSHHPIELEGLYLRYRNSPTAEGTAWSLVTAPYTLGARDYVVLSPYPRALTEIHPISDPSTFVERIDFPSISPTYSEVELVARQDRSVVDSVLYRRQWLGDTSSDRSHHALERRSPDADGMRRGSWGRAADAAEGGTPGKRNSVATDGEGDGDWPDDPNLTYEMLMQLLPIYADLAELELYSLEGQLLCRAKGAEVFDHLRRLREGRAPLPTLLCVVRVTLTSPDPERLPLTYVGRWAHIPSF